MSIITKITIKLANGEELTMTVDDAKQLYEDLHEVFGQKQSVFPSFPPGVRDPFGPAGPYKEPSRFNPHDPLPWNTPIGKSGRITYTSDRT